MTRLIVLVTLAACVAACTAPPPLSGAGAVQGSGAAADPASGAAAAIAGATDPADGAPVDALSGAAPSASGFFYGDRSAAISALPESAGLPVGGSAWSGDVTGFDALAALGLSAQAIYVVREDDLIAMDGERVWSFDLDQRPTRLQCLGLWPCLTLTDHSGRMTVVHYEVVVDPATGTDVWTALDCLSREQVAGGAGFPSDERLLENGGLIARHRTENQLCVRRVNASGPRRVPVGGT